MSFRLAERLILPEYLSGCQLLKKTFRLYLSHVSTVIRRTGLHLKLKYSKCLEDVSTAVK